MARKVLVASSSSRLLASSRDGLSINRNRLGRCKNDVVHSRQRDPTAALRRRLTLEARSGVARAARDDATEEDRVFLAIAKEHCVGSAAHRHCTHTGVRV